MRGRRIDLAELCLFGLIAGVFLSATLRDASSIGLLVALVWRRLSRFQAQTRSGWVLSATSAFLVANSVSAALAPHTAESLLNLRFYPLGLLVFLGVSETSEGPGRQRLAFFVVVLLAVLAADTSWQAYTGRSVVRGFTPVDGRFIGSLRHPTDVSVFPILLAVALPALGKGVPRLAGAAALIATAAAVVLSGTRVAWLALVALVFGLGWVSGRPRLAAFLATVAAIASLALAGRVETTAPGRLLSPAAYVGDERLLQWRAAVELFREAPVLGHGPHAFHRICVERHARGAEPFRDMDCRSAPYPHSLYLEALVGAGAIGLAAFIVLLVQPFLALSRLSASYERFRGAALSTLLLAMVGLVDLSLSKDWVHLALWLPLGLAVGPPRRKERLLTGSNRPATPNSENSARFPEGGGCNEAP